VRERAIEREIKPKRRSMKLTTLFMCIFYTMQETGFHALSLGSRGPVYSTKGEILARSRAAFRKEMYVYAWVNKWLRGRLTDFVSLSISIYSSIYLSTQITLSEVTYPSLSPSLSPSLYLCMYLLMLPHLN